MEIRCQQLTMTQLNELLKLLHKFEDFFMENLAPGQQIHWIFS